MDGILNLVIGLLTSLLSNFIANGDVFINEENKSFLDTLKHVPRGSLESLINGNCAWGSNIKGDLWIV